MTKKQIEQFNRMLDTLRKIHKGYVKSRVFRRICEREYGCSYEETLEMAYENLQEEAKQASLGVRLIKSEE